MARDSGHIVGLAHTSIRTRDLEASLAFYVGRLGFRQTYRALMRPEVHDGFFPLHYAEVRLGDCVLELLQPADPARVEPGQTGVIDHIALKVTGLEAVLARLQAGGAASRDTTVMEMPDLLGGARGLFIQGPSGESIELFELGGES